MRCGVHHTMTGTTGGHTSAPASECIILPILSLPTRTCVRRTAAWVSIKLPTVMFYIGPSQGPYSLESIRTPAPLLESVAPHDSSGFCDLEVIHTMLAAALRIVAISSLVATLLATIYDSDHMLASPALQSTLHTVCSSQSHVVSMLPTPPGISEVSRTAYHDQPGASNSIKRPRPISTITTTLTSTYTMPTHTAHSTIPDDRGYMDIVNGWRTKLGMNALIHDSELQTNAMDTVVVGNGAQTHKLNPGTLAQVIAPGKPDNFEHVFVGGWLCEISNLPGLGDTCASQSAGWNHNRQTGYADILTSIDYSRIGCALYASIWCCDLA